MGWRNYIGGISGGTLGFVAGDIPGALAGAKLGYEAPNFFTKKKMKLRNGKVVGISAKKVYGSGKKVYGSLPYAVRKTKANAKRQNRASRAGKSSGGVYKAGVIKNRAKSVKVKNGKRVKVSRQFRKKVIKAMEGPNVRGVYKLDYPQCPPIYTKNVDGNTQEVWSGQNDPLVNGGGYLFTADHFLRAASILFNGDNVTTGLDPAGTKKLPAYNLKLHVINSISTFRMRNNSQRIMHIRCFEMKPKSHGSNRIEAPNATEANQWSGSWANNANNIPAFTNPEVYWQSCLAQDFANDVSYTTTGGDSAPKSALSINVLHQQPGFSPALRGAFVTACLQTIRLEPGQEHTFSIYGPKDHILDYNKFINNTFYYNIRKEFSRAIMFTLHLDLTTGKLVSGAAPAYGGYLADADLNTGLVFERSDYFKIAMPQQAGMNVTGPENAVSTAAALGARKDVFIHDVVFNNTALPTADEIEEQNPIAQVQT